jgi:putative MATE family efflux protein
MRKFLRIITEALAGKEQHFTTGNIDRAIVLLSIPMVLEMAGESMFALVDAFFVAQIGADAVATVGLTESVLTLIYSLAIGLSAGATALVARRVGEENFEGAAISAGQAILVGVVFSIILGVAGFIFAPDVLRLLGASEGVITNGIGYTRVMFGSNIVIMLLFLLNAIFRGAGNAAIAMKSLWIANLINMVLDPFFIFGWGPFPEMGVAGAAVATTIGRGTGVLYQLYILFNGSSIVKVARRHLKAHWEVIGKLISLSAGGTFQFIIASASWIFLMKIVARFGSEVVAGYTIAIRLLVFTILPSWGMSNAAATLVGQNLGAQQPDRAEKSVWRTGLFNVVFMAVVSVFYLTFAPEMIRFFTDEPKVVEAGILSLRILSAGYIFYAYGMVVANAFNGAGDTVTPTVLNFICFWLLEIPLAYLLAIVANWGPAGVFWSVPISESILAILGIVMFRRGAWKKVQV